MDAFPPTPLPSIAKNSGHSSIKQTCYLGKLKGLRREGGLARDPRTREAICRRAPWVFVLPPIYPGLGAGKAPDAETPTGKTREAFSLSPEDQEMGSLAEQKPFCQ